MTPTAWQSIPTFIRFVVWVYTIGFAVSAVVWPAIIIAGLAAIGD